ncbi:MAG: type II toxin-antitoxin system MqsR family toxin [Clostridiales bacterium]
MDNIQKQLMNKFLIDIKKLISQGKFVFAGTRFKNIDFLKRYGLTIDDVKAVIFDLNTSNYKRGPTDDRNSKFEGMVWEFNYLLELSVDIDIYIKIRYNPPNEIVCISFHD